MLKNILLTLWYYLLLVSHQTTHISLNIESEGYLFSPKESVWKKSLIWKYIDPIPIYTYIYIHMETEFEILNNILVYISEDFGSVPFTWRDIRYMYTLQW